VIRRLLISVLVLAAALAGVVLVLLPPRPLAAPPAAVPLTWPVMRGAYHVHSRRSDGTGTVDEVAAAAARAGLQFVILTDHGDRGALEAPSYRSGVLCIDAVEISTQEGHYVALDLPRTPYRLAGPAADVIDDVRRFGGFGIVAHPASPKPELRWTAWEEPVDGLEWLSADSEWRDESLASLAAALFTYPIRPAATLARLLNHSHDVIARWDRLNATRHVVGLAAADAHARLGGEEQSDTYGDGAIAQVPSYQSSFQTFTNHVILSATLTGDAAADARLITSAIRGGHVFTSIDGLAALRAFEAKAVSGAGVATPGAYLDVTAPVAIEASIAAPEGTTLAVVRDGELLYETRAAALRIDVGRHPGAYRIEARLPSQGSRPSVPWLMTNAMYVGLREAHARAAIPRVVPGASTRSRIETEAWTAEASAGSTSTLQPASLGDGTPALEWQYALAGGPRGNQYAAMRFPVTGGIATQDRLQLRARSEQPMRVWAQLRAPGPNGPERWGKSFYVGPELTSVELLFDEFRPFESWSTAHPPLDGVDALLLVIDMFNHDPSSSGRVAITDLWFAR
jgi:hypothetical protein